MYILELDLANLLSLKPTFNSGYPILSNYIFFCIWENENGYQVPIRKRYCQSFLVYKTIFFKMFVLVLKMQILSHTLYHIVFI